MKLSSVAWLASPLLADAYRSNLRQVTQPAKTGVEYTSDFFQGTQLKQEQASLNNSDLTYTDRNGKQNFQPLGAQRAGEKGPLLLQDSALIDTLATFNRERIPERSVGPWRGARIDPLTR
jgi:catalase